MSIYLLRRAKEYAIYNAKKISSSEIYGKFKNIEEAQRCIDLADAHKRITEAKGILIKNEVFK